MSSDPRGDGGHPPTDAGTAPARGTTAGGDEPAGDSDGAAGAPPAAGADGAADQEGLGRRGWALVGVVVLATLVVPGVIYLFPAAPGRTGLPFLAAMLVLPLVPAAVLGLVAVWSAGTDEGEELD